MAARGGLARCLVQRRDGLQEVGLRDLAIVLHDGRQALVARQRHGCLDGDAALAAAIQKHSAHVMERQLQSGFLDGPFEATSRAR